MVTTRDTKLHRKCDKSHESKKKSLYGSFVLNLGCGKESDFAFPSLQNIFQKISKTKYINPIFVITTAAFV